MSIGARIGPRAVQVSVRRRMISRSRARCSVRLAHPPSSLARRAHTRTGAHRASLSPWFLHLDLQPALLAPRISRSHCRARPSFSARPSRSHWLPLWRRTSAGFPLTPLAIGLCMARPSVVARAITEFLPRHSFHGFYSQLRGFLIITGVTKKITK